MHAWRLDRASDRIPEKAGDLDRHEAVFLAALSDGAAAAAWMAVDDYHGTEATVLFDAPPGDHFHRYVGALLPAAIDEASRLGYTSLLAHWRAGWSMAAEQLRANGFAETSPGIWRRSLTR